MLWSVVEKTALAEAEIEYHDHTSDTIHVRFPVVKSNGGKLDGAAIVIWTTTPWTMPGNRALAYGPDIDYALVEVDWRRRRQQGPGRREAGAGARAGRRGSPRRRSSPPKIVAEVAADDLEGADRGASAARPGLRVRRAPAGGRLRHDRCRHRLRAHRAGPWRRRLRAGRRQRRRGAGHGRRGRHLLSARAAVRRQARLHAGRQEGRRQPHRHRAARRGGQAAGLGPHHALAIRIPGAPRRR